MSLDPLTAGLDLAGTIINKIWPNPADQAEALYKLEELKQRGDLAELNAFIVQLTGQLEINKEEAKHASVFVAGWRPAVGWVCAFSLGYVGILDPLMRFIALMFGYEGEFPVIDTFLTMQILAGMLGLSHFRSKDKLEGVATSNTSPLIRKLK